MRVGIMNKEAIEQAIELLARSGADQRLLDLLYILRRNDQRFLTRVHEFARRIEK